MLLSRIVQRIEKACLRLLQNVPTIVSIGLLSIPLMSISLESGGETWGGLTVVAYTGTFLSTVSRVARWQWSVNSWLTITAAIRTPRSLTFSTHGFTTCHC